MWTMRRAGTCGRGRLARASSTKLVPVVPKTIPKYDRHSSRTGIEDSFSCVTHAFSTCTFWRGKCKLIEHDPTNYTFSPRPTVYRCFESLHRQRYALGPNLA